MTGLYRVIYTIPFLKEVQPNTAVEKIIKSLLVPIDDDPNRYIVPDIDVMEENIQESAYNTTMDNYDNSICKENYERAFVYARRLAKKFPGGEIFAAC